VPATGPLVGRARAPTQARTAAGRPLGS